MTDTINPIVHDSQTWIMVSTGTQPTKCSEKEAKSVYADSICTFAEDSFINHFVQRFLVNANKVILALRNAGW